MQSLLLAAFLLTSALPAVAAEDQWTCPYWIACPEPVAGPSAAFRKIVTFSGKPTKCWLTISATDLKDYRAEVRYAVYLNGQKVVQRQSPGDRLQMDCPWYQVAAVEGENVVTVQVECISKGGVPAFNLEIDCLLEPGGRLMARSDGSWKCQPAIPMQDGWQARDFNDSRWSAAREVGRKWGSPRAIAGGRTYPAVPPSKIAAAAEEQFRNLLDLQVAQTSLNIVPRPHRLQLLDGETVLGTKGKLHCQVFLAADPSATAQPGQRLAAAMEHLLGVRPAIQRLDRLGKNVLLLSSGPPNSSNLAERVKRSRAALDGLGPEAFAIVPYAEHGEQEFVLCGTDEHGLGHAVRTFLQLLRRRGDAIVAARAQVIDWPDVSVRGLIGDRWEKDVAWLWFYGFNQVFVITNVADPIRPGLAEFVALLRRWGLEPVFYIHPGADFCFSNPRHVELVTRQLAAARDAGFREATLQCDDFPGNPTLQDAAAYGGGLAGLARAHRQFLATVAPAASRLGIRLYFCPFVYCPGSNPKPDEYLSIIDGIPSGVEVFTSARQPTWLHKFTRGSMFWSNELMDRSYTGIRWLAEYPPVAKDTASRFKGAWVMTHAFGVTRANTLCYLSNWWNQGTTLPLASALEREWGMPAARFLGDYAKGLGVHAEWAPEMNIYAPPAPAADYNTPVTIDTWLEAPSKANLDQLRQRATQARRAKDLDWTNSGVSAQAVSELRSSARRVELLYSLIADWMETRLTRSGAIPTSDKRMAELRTEIDSTIAELKSAGMTGYVLFKLRKKWE